MALYTLFVTLLHRVDPDVARDVIGGALFLAAFGATLFVFLAA